MTTSDAPVFDPEATSIRAIIPAPQGGYIAMSGFPGLLHDIEGTPYLDPSQMDETLVGLAKAGAEHFLVLPEEDELPAGAFAMLRASAAQHGLTLTFASIQDFSVPEAAFLQGWPQVEQRLLDAMARGETVALCCQYGAGRSGLIAALLLLACDTSVKDAIPLVRSHFPEAIENAAQENWLRARTTGRSAGAGGT